MQFILMVVAIVLAVAVDWGLSFAPFETMFLVALAGLVPMAAVELLNVIPPPPTSPR